MNVDGNEVLAVEITCTENANTLTDPTIPSIQRAPSSFVLTSSNTVLGISISETVISAGKTMVISALSAIVGKYFGQGNYTKVKLVAGAMATIEALASYIIESGFTTYETNIIRNTYVYSGCSWLLYAEFEYPEGYTVGAYQWTDNPSLGIALYVCKIASQSYPY